MESIISTNQKGKAILQQHSYSYNVNLDCSNSAEESGWTFYLEDFYESAPSKKRETYGDGNHNRGISFDGESLSSTSCERATNSCKRRKTKAIYVDLDLEDTATSPDFSLKGKTIRSNNIVEGDEQATDLVGNGRDYNTELGRKGLCLVPFSMLFNCVS